MDELMMIYGAGFFAIFVCFGVLHLGEGFGAP